jgi:hypothetical protein
MSWIRTVLDRQERLKNYIHNGFRYPLPKYGQYIMGFVYFSIPVISGWYVMQWAISKSHDSIGYNGEHLPNKSIQGIGDRRPIHDNDGGGDSGNEHVLKYEKVGAGGWGGGVHLVVSDEEEQKKNRKKLRKLLKQLQLDEPTTTTNDKDHDKIANDKQ